MNSPAAAVGNGGRDGHHSRGSQKRPRFRRDAVGELFEKINEALASMEFTNADLPRPASVLNFDNNPYLELQAQPPPTERDRGVMWETSDDRLEHQATR